MFITEFLLIIILSYMTPPSSPIDSSKKKRKVKCPSCRIPHSEHDFGLPGPSCQGPPSPAIEQQQTSSRNQSSGTIMNPPSHCEDPDTTAIHFHRRSLQLLQQEEETILASI